MFTGNIPGTRIKKCPFEAHQTCMHQMTIDYLFQAGKRCQDRFCLGRQGLSSVLNCIAFPESDSSCVYLGLTQMTTMRPQSYQTHSDLCQVWILYSPTLTKKRTCFHLGQSMVVSKIEPNQNQPKSTKISQNQSCLVSRVGQVREVCIVAVSCPRQNQTKSTKISQNQPKSGKISSPKFLRRHRAFLTGTEIISQVPGFLRRFRDFFAGTEIFSQACRYRDFFC